MKRNLSSGTGRSRRPSAARRLTRLERFRAPGAAILCLVALAAAAQPVVYEVEPNDTPAEATRVAGAVTLMGEMAGADQDAFLWTVSDVDAQKRWTFELNGIPGRLTIVEVLRLEFAENGVDVAGVERLFKFGSRDGARPVFVEDLVLEPGEYLLGLAKAGGEPAGGPFRPPVDSVDFRDARAAAGDSVAQDGETGGYRLAIREGRRLPLTANPKPHDTRATAQRVRPDSEVASYAAEAKVWYGIELGAAQAARRWDIEAQVPVGRRVRATLHDANGQPLVRAEGDRHGTLAFRDLGLEAGSYFVELDASDGELIRALAVRSVGVRIEGSEAEPNDQWSQANRVDPGRAWSGRMGTRNDADYFAFSLDEELAGNMLSLRLETAAGQKFRFSLLDGQGQVLQSRDGAGSIELVDLLLTPGQYGVFVGRGTEGAEYEVSLRPTGQPVAGIETEPNDTVALAVGVPANNRIKGRFVGEDTDFYRFLVTGEPQLWRFQVIGDGVQEVAYHDGAGIQSQRVRPAAGQRRIRLDNLFLLPGRHHVSVRGRGPAEYTLLALPVGPPDPNGEREPNDDATRMQRLRIGQTRTGTLEDAADRDNYRFFLADWDHIRLEVKPPPDGSILAQLNWGGAPMRRSAEAEPGEPLVLKGVFPPGDYRLELAALKTSEAEYRLSLERLDRFACPADCEPNDNPAFASPVPPSLVLEGRVGEWRDDDWWALPVLERPSEVILSPAERRDLALVESGDLGKSITQWDPQVQAYRGVVPAGIRTYLRVSQGHAPDYRIELRFTNGPAAAPEPAALPSTLAVELDANAVGAYRPYGQTVTGRVVLAQRGATPLTLDLEALSSDRRWRVALDRSTVTVPPGGRLAAGLTVHVPADAWADTPVRISARAFATAGGQVEASAEVTPGRESPTVNPVRAWAAPEALRGGFNVAWQALGGRRVTDPGETTVGTVPGVGAGFHALFDDIAAANLGMSLVGRPGRQDAVPVTVELAGDQPVDVAGFAFIVLQHHGATRYPRDVELQLSNDGRDFKTVASAVLDPVPREQFVALAQPRAARFARLLLDTNWEGRGILGLGEWKVIARPGVDISGGSGLDLASPERGGHVVWSKPPIGGYWDESILTAKEDFRRVGIAAGERLEWVVGFHHDRAARITRLEWQDSAQAEPQERITSVALAVSVDSPVGPWEPLGEWTLPAGGGSGEFELEKPVWARFLRYSTPVLEARGVRAAPERLRIWEQPTQGEYRSILTEWGDDSQAAIYEALPDIGVDAPLAVAGHNSRAKAAPLEPGKAVGGVVQLGQHEHWYRIGVPGGQNMLSVRVGGDPTVRTEVHLESAAGEPIPLRKLVRDSTPREHVFEAVVTPGTPVYLRVEEPPRNVLFLWDTSPSIGAMLPVIYNALLAYAADLVPGRDAANFMPFGRTTPLLRDWYGEPYIAQTVLNEHPRTESSSDAEKTLHAASRALASRAGSKAIVIITDAETPRHAAVWDAFAEVRPRIFALGAGVGSTVPAQAARARDHMQDWSRVNGGHYGHLLNDGELEIAFDRAATLLRAPAPYHLIVSSDYREAPGPGRLAVVLPLGGGGAVGGGAGAAAIELILDASGSMLQRMGDKRRIEVARAVLTGVVSELVPAGTPLALRVFGHRQANSCRTDLEVPLAPLDPPKLARTLAGITAMNLARTPIADSLARVEADLRGAQGRKIVVLVTDGEETCDGDPEKAIRELRETGIDLTLNIVGFALDDPALESQFEAWAELGGGRYFPARDEQGLSAALTEALRTPYSVYDHGGSLVAEGAVDGAPLELAAGFYRVVVATSPPASFERVEVPGGQQVEIRVGPQ